MLTGCDFDDVVSVWQPAKAEFSRIRTALRIRESSLLHSALGKSIERAAVTEAEYRFAIDQQREVSISEAQAGLRSTIREARRFGNRAAVEAELEKYISVWNKQLIAPMRESAANTEDLGRKSLILLLADMMEDYFHRTNDVGIAREVIAGDIHAVLGPLSEDALKELHRTIDYVSKLYKQNLFTSK